MLFVSFIVSEATLSSSYVFSLSLNPHVSCAVTTKSKFLLGGPLEPRVYLSLEKLDVVSPDLLYP